MKITRAWSETDLKRLAEIAAAGGTAVRASAALKRSIANCQKQAREMGTPFKSVYRARMDLREKSERELAGW
jgi:hypothetical protein